MREIPLHKVTQTVRDLCIEANTCLREDQLAALRRAHTDEESPLGREVLSNLLENASVSCGEGVPFCQDTGYAVFFVELGEDVRFTGSVSQNGDSSNSSSSNSGSSNSGSSNSGSSNSGSSNSGSSNSGSSGIGAAIDEGVRRGYVEGYLRSSLVKSPVQRINTEDNTPAVVYYDLVPGDTLELTALIKGGGCDNMSALKMLTPAEGVEGMKRFIVETIENAGPNASPPMTVGVGIGGPFEKAAQLAKKALTRTSGEPSEDPALAELEREILEEINATGIGPAGYGGTQTALAVHVESFPTHIASFPVAVNLDCHSHRTRKAEL